jgi:hypothetical protein
MKDTGVDVAEAFAEVTPFAEDAAWGSDTQ